MNKKFKSPYSFYIFNLIGNNEKYKNTKFAKCGEAIDPDNRIYNQWDRDRKKYEKMYGGSGCDFLIDKLISFDGVFYNEEDNSYTLIGNPNVEFKYSDSFVRQYLVDIGCTSDRDFEIYPYGKSNGKKSFSKEGLKFVNEISDEEVINKIDTFKNGVKNRLPEFKKYFYVLSAEEYNDFLDKFNKKVGYVIYDVKKFSKYISKVYNINIDVEFLELLYVNSVYEDDFSYIDRVLDIISTKYYTKEFKRKIYDIDYKIQHHQKHEYIINCLESWLYGKIIINEIEENGLW